MEYLNFCAGDYVRYKLKNELGKVKRLNNHLENHAFCWFHEGDTASGVSFGQIECVLPGTVAMAMTEDEIKAYLHEARFSNDYAVNAIVERH